MIQHESPVILIVWFVTGDPASVVPLHCTTVPFSLAVAVNAKVEVISARVPVNITVGLAMFVRVATKLKLTQFTVRGSLQAKLLPVDVVLVNRIRVLAGRNGSTIQSRTAPWLTVQV